MRDANTRFGRLLLILIIVLNSSNAMAASRWEWILACGKYIAAAGQWLRNDPNGNYSPETLRIASEAVPASGNKLLDWLATVRPYLNPQVSAAITRGLKIFPELTNSTPPELPEPHSTDRQDVWDNLLSKEISLQDFEALIPKAMELLSEEERKTIARFLFTRGLRSAIKDPQNANDDTLRRAILLVKSDTQVRRGLYNQMRRQFPALGSLPEYGED